MVYFFRLEYEKRFCEKIEMLYLIFVYVFVGVENNFGSKTFRSFFLSESKMCMLHQCYSNQCMGLKLGFHDTEL